MPKKEANDLKIAIKSCFTTLVEDTTLIQNAATPYPVEFAFSSARPRLPTPIMMR